MEVATALVVGGRWGRIWKYVSAATTPSVILVQHVAGEIAFLVSACIVETTHISLVDAILSIPSWPHTAPHVVAGGRIGWGRFSRI